MLLMMVAIMGREELLLRENDLLVREMRGGEQTRQDGRSRVARSSHMAKVAHTNPTCSPTLTRFLSGK